MKVNAEDTAAAGFLGIIGMAAGALLSGVVLVTLSAMSGLIISWLFPQTFAAFMTLIGLGQYSLWQLNAVIAFIALLLRPFK